MRRHCDARVIYFDVHEWALYVDAQHRGGDGNDLAVKIEPAR
jgi:hypothetical protein